MSSVKVSQLSEKTSPSGSEELLINDGGTSKKITIANLPDNDTTYSVGDGGLTEINFTSAKDTKLTGIETGATADQTGAEIKTAYEAEANTNAFTDADHSKLDGIEASANNYSHPATHSISEVSGLQTALDGKEPTFLKNTGFNKNLGTTAGTVSEGNHNHSGVYEPADATILKDADIGTSVLAPNGDGSQLTGIDALPSQTGHSGKYLGTDGTNASWNTLDTDANSTTKGLYEHSNTISADYTITSGNNALTAGPITINTGVSVTVPTGSTWVIA